MAMTAVVPSRLRIKQRVQILDFILLRIQSGRFEFGHFNGMFHHLFLAVQSYPDPVPIVPTAPLVSPTFPWKKHAFSSNLKHLSSSSGEFDLLTQTLDGLDIMYNTK